MKRTYQFDQAATSFPKAEGVAEAMTEYLTQVGAVSYTHLDVYKRQALKALGCKPFSFVHYAL